MQELLLDSYQDPNQFITRNDNGGIISSQSDGPGAPGGSSICEQLISLKGTSHSSSMSWSCLPDMAEQHCSMFVACPGCTPSRITS